jgi:hypothetical protein
MAPPEEDGEEALPLYYDPDEGSFWAPAPAARGGGAGAGSALDLASGLGGQGGAEPCIRELEGSEAESSASASQGEEQAGEEPCEEGSATSAGGQLVTTMPGWESRAGKIRGGPGLDLQRASAWAAQHTCSGAAQMQG